jgi:hypothetical protein
MKIKNKKNVEFEHNLTNMLIHLYNGKQCNEYIKEYKTILDCVSHSQFWSLYTVDLDQEEFWAAESWVGYQVPQQNLRYCGLGSR